MIMIDNAYIELYIYPPTLQAKNMWYIKIINIYIDNYIYTHPPIKLCLTLYIPTYSPAKKDGVVLNVCIAL